MIILIFNSNFSTNPKYEMLDIEYIKAKLTNIPMVNNIYVDLFKKN